MDSREIILRQTDEKLQLWAGAEKINIPRSGWINAIRKTLGMSLKQLGKKMKITPQSISDLEEREKGGTVTLNTLRNFANAMEMDFVYGFIPKEGTLQAMIKKRAEEIASEIIMKTDKNMKLEDQGLDDEIIRQRISEKTDRIMMEKPGYLWD